MRQLYDTHVHVWTLDEKKYPWNPILAIAKIPTYAFTPEQLLTDMDANGVERAVLVQSSSYGWDNAYLLDVLKKYPDRFRGVVLADPANLDFARHVAGLRSSPGVVGMRFHLLEPEHVDIFSQGLDRIRKGALDSELVVDFQVRPGNFAPVVEMARSAPKLRIVIDHLGLPWSGGPQSRGLRDLLDLAEFANVYVKLSGLDEMPRETNSPESKTQFAEAVVRSFGPGRVMWGSNCPHALASSTFSDLAGAVDSYLPSLSEDDRKLVRWETARQFWDLQ